MIILSFVFFNLKIFAVENIDERVKKLTLEFAGSYGNDIEFEDLNVLKNLSNLID